MSLKLREIPAGMQMCMGCPYTFSDHKCYETNKDMETYINKVSETIDTQCPWIRKLQTNSEREL